MAYQFKAALICDGCGAELDLYPQKRPSDAPRLASMILRRALAAGWVERDGVANLWALKRHFCPFCRTLPEPVDNYLQEKIAKLKKLKEGAVKV